MQATPKSPLGSTGTFSKSEQVESFPLEQFHCSAWSGTCQVAKSPDRSPQCEPALKVCLLDQFAEYSLQVSFTPVNVLTVAQQCIYFQALTCIVLMQHIHLDQAVSTPQCLKICTFIIYGSAAHDISLSKQKEAVFQVVSDIAYKIMKSFINA